MKLILSRKGFDSSSGGVANPLLPDGSLLPLPIPDRQSPITYESVRWRGASLAPVVEDLTRGRVRGREGAHLDPDLDHESLVRPRRWRPLFGQCGAAQGHLTKKMVGVGDVFLYFGWFRNVEQCEAGYRYVKGAPDRHLFFGWFQVGAVRDLSRRPVRSDSWMAYHPHCHGVRSGQNVLYTAAPRLRVPGQTTGLRGAGIVPEFHPGLVLTERGASRGRWRLPDWFHPDGRASVLSYHEDPSRWQRSVDGVKLRSVSRGQDFVLDTDHYPEALPWLMSLIAPK